MGNVDNITNSDIFMLLMDMKKDNEEIKTNIKQIKEELSNQTSAIEQLNKKVDVLETENKVLREKLLVTQRNSKRNNIIIFGIPEEEDAKDYFTTTIKTKLNIDLEDIDISNIYRIGTKIQNKPRAVLLEFVRNTKKREIFQNLSKFKGSGLTIAHDLIEEDREQQQLLYKHLKLAKDKKYQAKIIRNKLIVNGETFTYEQLKNTELEDPRATRTQIIFPVRGNRSAPPTPQRTPDSPIITNSTELYADIEETKKYENVTEERREGNKGYTPIPSVADPPSKSTRSNKKPSDTTLASPSVKKSKK